MNVSCDIIRDILPLYAEDMVSDATRELVDGHLCGCDGCTKELAALKKKEPVPVDADTGPIKRIGKSIKKQKILTVCCVLLTIVSLIWSCVLFMDSNVSLTKDQTIKSVELREDSGLAVGYHRGVQSRNSIPVGNDDYIISATSTRYMLLRGMLDERKYDSMTAEEFDAMIREWRDTKEVTQDMRDWYSDVDVNYCFRKSDGTLMLWGVPALEENFFQEEPFSDYAPSGHDYDLWYIEPDGSASLLWNGGDGKFPTGQYGPGYDTGVYIGIVAICLVLAAAGGVAAILLRKSQWKEFAVRICILAGSAAAHFLLVTGGDFTDIMGGRVICWMDNFFVTWILLFLTAGCWYYLHYLKKQDKAL